jgi:transposase
MLIKDLGKADIKRLNHERYHYPCPIVQKRLHAIYYKATKGFSNKAVGELADLSRDSVGTWVNLYESFGIEALYRFNYGTNKSDLAKHSFSILDSFDKEPPMSSNEAESRIEGITGIRRSPTQIRKFMHNNGLRYLKAGHIPAKADTGKQREWVKAILEPAIEEAQNGGCCLLFMDAVHFILQPFICFLWCKVRQFVKAASGRNRINVLGALNAVTKEILTLNNTTYISAETIVAFLKQIKEHYGDLPIKIVLDNARYQHCLLVEQCAKQLNITLLFLPSYSPNLNIIERLWKFTKKKVLYAKYYDSPGKFHDAITTFFQTANQNFNSELNTLLTLKFQFFQHQDAEIYTV